MRAQRHAPTAHFHDQSKRATFALEGGTKGWSSSRILCSSLDAYDSSSLLEVELDESELFDDSLEELPDELPAPSAVSVGLTFAEAWPEASDTLQG
jgi:hypothetical protein